MPHAYVTVTLIKGTGALNVDGTVYDTRLRQVAEAVTQAIDRYTDRTFQPFDGTRFYSGDGGTLLLIDDLAVVGTLAEDNRNDGTFGTDWAAADFLTLPFNADPTSEWGRPITRFQVSPKSNGTQDAFLRGARNYRLIGTFGFVSITTTVTGSASGSQGTGVTFTVDSTGTIEPGMTILVDTERMYVLSTSGTALTVQRGVQNSVVGTHASGTAINYYDYPSPIKEAAFMQAARLWQRRNSGFATTVGLPELGMITTFRGLDDDVKHMLNPYRRLH